MASRRRRFRPRRSETPAPPAAAEPRTPIEPGRRSRLGIVLALLFGYWLARVATFLPTDPLQVLDIGVALLSAVLLAVWYRRGARRYMETRQAERQRDANEAAATTPEEPVAEEPRE